MQSVLREQLDALSSSLPESDAKASIEVLTTLYQNIASHPGEDQYRRIRIENRRFRENVWCHSPAAQFLLLGGWVEAGEFIVFVDDSLTIQSVLEVLGKHASAAAQISAGANQLYQAVPEKQEEKDKLIEENMKRLREHQQRIAAEKKRLTDQIEADRRETTHKESRPSQAKAVYFGGNVKRFEDIGVDLNKGG